MSNLENLVQRILDEAKEKANLIMEEANKAKEELIASKEKEANENKRRVLERAKREADLAKERLISGAELKVRNEKLLAKQEVMERVFSLAKERLKSLDEDKYVSFLKNTIKGLNLTGGEILVVPEHMKATVKKLGIALKVSEDETVESGFLIKDKGIILNYTFDSLVEHYRDEMETEIAQELFKE
ncbi:MAG: V-type ATP synthase subunit E [Tissierellia bacterium]|nr:V-type ATP synthase subunit E [Tissierellia bacterium]